MDSCGKSNTGWDILNVSINMRIYWKKVDQRRFKFPCLLEHPVFQLEGFLFKYVLDKIFECRKITRFKQRQRKKCSIRFYQLRCWKVLQRKLVTLYYMAHFRAYFRISGSTLTALNLRDYLDHLDHLIDLVID